MIKKFNKINFSLLTVITLLIDQLSKIFIINNYYKLINKKILIFSIDFVKNDGAAFNILSGNRILLSFFSILSSLIIIYLIFLKNNINQSIRYGLCFILSGSIGNGIDRINNGYVVDFIKFNFINFPVFNFADVFINIGIFIIALNYFFSKNY